MNKNDIVDIEITDLGKQGEGIGKYRGYTLFVKDAVPGDKCRVKIIKDKKSYGYGKLLEILAMSPDRVAPRCPVAGPCGGCTLQALEYKSQLKYKQDRVEELLKRIGKAEGFLMEPIAGMEHPYNYRNKAQFPVRRGKDGTVKIGFYAGHTHSVIEHEHCCIEHEDADIIAETVRKWMERFSVSPYDEATGEGLLRHILIRTGFATGEIQVCVVINGEELPHAGELIAELKKIKGMTGICVNINKHNTNVILGDRMEYVWGKEYIKDYIGDLEFYISPRSFYQVNPVQTKVIYDTVREYAAAGKADEVADLYCGIGTIGLYLAKDAGKVTGVEIIPDAVRDAEMNSRINGIKNAEFYCGKAEELLPDLVKEGKVSPNIVITDPPRKGCDRKLLECIASLSPERVVYVSCDPATLARDVDIMRELGYVLEKAKCVDAFCHTSHVETVALLRRMSRITK